LELPPSRILFAYPIAGDCARKKAAADVPENSGYILDLQRKENTIAGSGLDPLVVERGLLS